MIENVKLEDGELYFSTDSTSAFGGDVIFFGMDIANGIAFDYWMNPADAENMLWALQRVLIEQREMAADQQREMARIRAHDILRWLGDE